MLKHSFTKAATAMGLCTALIAAVALPAPAVIGIGTMGAIAAESDGETICGDDVDYTVPVYTSGNWAYALTGELLPGGAHEGDAVIVGYTESPGSVLEVPAALDGHKVASIGDDCYTFAHDFGEYGNALGIFKGRADLEQVILPEGLEQIGASVFEGCTNLADVKLPSTLRTIRHYAFQGCTALKSISLPEGFAHMDSRAFAGTSIKTLVVPGSCTATHTGAFAGMPKLETVVFGEGLTWVGSSDVFASSPKLKTIKLPASLSDVRPHAFDGCSATNVKLASGAKAFSLKKGVLVNEKKHQVVHAFGSVSSSYTVPAGVTSIGSYAFAGNKAIRSVVVGKSCKTVGAHAFYKCTKLKSVTIGGKVKTIKDAAFAQTALTKLVIGGKVKTIGYDAFALKAKAGARKSPLRSVTVPKSVKSIGGNALGCYLGADDRYKADKTFTIKCKKGSAAATYAKKRGMKVKYV